MQRCHEESYRVVAVEGIHPEEWFVFETKLREHIPEIESVLETPKSTALNHYSQPIGRYNILCKKSNFSKVAKKLHQELSGLYHRHLQDEKKELQENHQLIRVTSRLPRSDDSSGMMPSMDSRNTFFTHSASIFEVGQIDWECNMDFPSVLETNISAPKQSRPSSPSITSCITGTSSSTLAPGGPSYASVVARPQQPSAPPAPNPLDSSFPPDFAARKKVCPNAPTSESNLSEASLAAREDEDAPMDHVS
jgi:hypothetical protein